jgi:hypothetical protein
MTQHPERNKQMKYTIIILALWFVVGCVDDEPMGNDADDSSDLACGSIDDLECFGDILYTCLWDGQWGFVENCNADGMECAEGMDGSLTCQALE